MSVGLAVFVAFAASGSPVQRLETAGATPLTADVTVTVPGCVVDPTDVVGWWKGEDDLAAEIGPDLTGSVGYQQGLIGRAMSLDGTSTVAVDGLPG